MKEKVEQAESENKTDLVETVITESEPKVEQAESEKVKLVVKVTKGGISKYIDSSQAAAFKANGWK
jgi:hypothetical protein